MQSLPIEPLNWREWSIAIFGILLGQSISFLIVWDIVRYYTGSLTISKILLDIGLRYPIIPALVCLVIGLILGALAGHLWAPQYPRG